MIKRHLITFVFLLYSALFLFSAKEIFAEPISTWASTTNLPYEIASHESLGFGENLFVIGGATNDDNSNILKSTKNPDGSLANWSLISNLPDTRYWTASSLSGSRIYILGGANFSSGQTVTKDVFAANINPDGSISSWDTLNDLPGDRALGNSVVVNNRIYYAGGFDDLGRHDEIFYADINPDGTIGTWTTSSVPLPIQLYAFGMVESNNYIYIVGGANSTNVHQSKVYKSKVNPDGSLNSWVEVAPLPEPVFRGSSIVVGSTILTIGGEDGSTVLDKVYYSKINPDGSLTAWQQSANSLPIPVSASSVARVGNTIYLTGGWNGNYLDTVFYAQLDNSFSLSVPLIKQTDAPWNDDLYDSADLWSTNGNDIAKYGCALASAAMVFNYHGLHSIDESTDLDPGTLNTWLKTQSDGFISNGLVNWLALSRLSKQIASLNGAAFDALEFTKVLSNDHESVKSELIVNNPQILREPGHFIVAKGYTDTTLLINDPYYSRDDLTPYGNFFQNISRFTPSFTDLSYIMLAVDQSVDIKLFDEIGNEIGTPLVDFPITDPSGTASSSTQPLKFIYYPKPSSGEYTIEITSPGPYKLTTYLYDLDGNPKIQNFEDQNDNSYLVTFDRDVLDNSNVEKVGGEISYDSLIAKIKELYEQKEIKKLGTYLAFLVEAKLAKASQNHDKLEKIFLVNLQKSIVIAQKTNRITESAKDQLLEQVNALIEKI